MIPEGWRNISIGDICAIFDGPHATPKKIYDGPVFLGVQNLNAGRLDLADVAHVSEENFIQWTRRVTPLAGDLVFSYETAIGQAALIPPDFRCCLGRRLGLLRAYQDKVIPEYLVYVYLGTAFQETLRQNTIHGSTVDRIPLTRLPEFELLLPPLPEQRAITAILSTWDEAITLTERLIAALRQRKQALMQLLLTGKVRFKEFEGEEFYFCPTSRCYLLPRRSWIEEMAIYG